MVKWLSFLIKKMGNVRHATNGLAYAVMHEFNFNMFLVFSVLLIVLGFRYADSFPEIMFYIGSSVLLLSAELKNSSQETLANVVRSEEDPQIKIVKDLSSASVLVAGFPMFVSYVHLVLQIYLPHAAP